MQEGLDAGEQRGAAEVHKMVGNRDWDLEEGR